MVKITSSSKRNPEPKSVNLDSVKITTWGAIKINKSHFFPSSFQIKTSKATIYIDPIEINTNDKADYIFITHAHPDHLSIKDIKQIIKPSTRIICSKGVAKKLSKHNYNITVLAPSESIDLNNGIHCEATYAYNTKSVFLWIKAHPKSKQNVGFILSVDGIKIYHAGDTDYIPEMNTIKGITVALIPIGGDNLTMNAEEGAKIVNEIKPQIAIPMHFEVKDSIALKTFQNFIKDKIKIELLN
ncbi:MAG: MBL fold metallo-hydrolase [bacterium]